MNRLPPPVITLAGILAIFALDYVFPAFRRDWLQGGLAASIFFTLGAGLILWSGHAFRKHQTTVNPLRPERASTLVTSGPYRFSRNPMYLAMVFVLWSALVYTGNVLGFAVALGIILYFDTVQIAAEEAALDAKFGEAFTDYTQRVRKWV